MWRSFSEKKSRFCSHDPIFKRGGKALTKKVLLLVALPQSRRDGRRRRQKLQPWRGCVLIFGLFLLDSGTVDNVRRKKCCKKRWLSFAAVFVKKEHFPKEWFYVITEAQCGIFMNFSAAAIFLREIKIIFRHFSRYQNHCGRTCFSST